MGFVPDIISRFYTVVSMFVAPLLPLYFYPRFGYMKVFAASITSTGLALLLFGVNHYISNKYVPYLKLVLSLFVSIL